MIISWVPWAVWLVNWPDPDEIVQTVIVDESISHHVVELFSCLWTLGSPPEPTTISLVKRSPKDWNSSISESLELTSDGIKISNGSPVLISTLLDSSSYIEPSVWCIECASLNVASSWREPVPVEFYNTILARLVVVVNSSLSGSVVPWRPVIMPGVVRRVVLEIEALDGWSLSQEVLQIVPFSNWSSESLGVPLIMEFVEEIPGRLANNWGWEFSFKRGS